MGRLLAALITSLVVVAGAGYGLARAGDAPGAVEVCAGCHKGMAEKMKDPSVHRPFKEGRCTACHNPHASRHEGLLSGAPGGICFNCHDRARGFKGKVVHAPVEEGRCGACHDSHSSKIAGLLKAATGDTCYSCHPKEKVVTGSRAHPKVLSGNCGACHNPHASDSPGLLAKGRREVCAGCHYGQARSARACRYEVRGSDCAGCHSPHSSNSPALIKASVHKPFGDKSCGACHRQGSTELLKDGSALCLDCHAGALEGFKRLNTHLVSGGEKNPCVNCHSPHASDGRLLMKDSEDRVCYACHEDTRARVEASKHRHPLLKQCSDCHLSHGSDARLFLKKGDETCSTEACHATQGRFVHPIGEKVIDPRSMSPMNCSTCHDPMGSPETFILRFEKDKDLCIQCHQM
jgi:predicted CXXCH cytochrome family protein